MVHSHTKSSEGWSIVSRVPGCCSTCSQSPLSPCVLGEKEIPSCNNKNLIFLKEKGSTVENCPTLMRIPNVSWRPTKLEEWGKQWEVADSRPCYPALAFNHLNWDFGEEFHPGVFTASQLWTGPCRPFFLLAGSTLFAGSMAISASLLFPEALESLSCAQFTSAFEKSLQINTTIPKTQGSIPALGQPIHNFFLGRKTTHRPLPGTALHWQPHTNHKSYSVRLMWAMTQATWFTSTVTIIHFMLIY